MDRHHRHSIRIPGYDYSQAGAYFVTIVSHNRENLFGIIHDGEMILNPFGEIIVEEWIKTPAVRPNVELGEYIIMPNHVHGILVFVDDIVGATRRVTPTNTTTLQSGSLGAVIGQFKSIVTKRINGWHNVTGRPVWQRNYYEHIIRNERDLQNKTDYIEANPMLWDDDDENPINIQP